MGFDLRSSLQVSNCNDFVSPGPRQFNPAVSRVLGRKGAAASLYGLPWQYETYNGRLLLVPRFNYNVAPKAKRRTVWVCCSLPSRP